MKTIYYAITIVLFLMTSCVTKSIMVSCPPSGARIVVDGDYAGSQQATARFRAFSHVTVSAPDYITQSFTLRRGSSDVTDVCLKPDRDDSWEASVPASDIANKRIRIIATSDKTDDEVWYTLIRYASDYFDDFTVNDMGAGWAKSTWVTRTFSRVRVRTRLEIKRNPGNRKEFTVFLSSQYSKLKNCTDDECFQVWDRVLKTYVELPSALQTAVQ